MTSVTGHSYNVAIKHQLMVTQSFHGDLHLKAPWLHIYLL